jgi:hypothetical protein
VLEIDLDRFSLAMDYVEGCNDRAMTVGELALIYSVLPDLLLELTSPQGVMLTTNEEE